MSKNPSAGVSPDRLSSESVSSARGSIRPPRAERGLGSWLRDPVWAPLIRKGSLGCAAVLGVALLGMQAPAGSPAPSDPGRAAASPEVKPIPSVVAGEVSRAPAPGPAPPPPPCRPTAFDNGSSPQVIALNTATAEQLDRLPGVGPKKAEEIIHLRTRLGRFKKVVELLRVRGISPKTLNKWKGLVVIDDPAPIPSDVSSGAPAAPPSVPPTLAPNPTGRGEVPRPK